MNKFLDLIIVIYDYARWSLMYLNLKTGKKIRGGGWDIILPLLDNP